MNNQVFLVGDDGTYEPIGHISDAEIAVEPVSIPPRSDGFVVRLYFTNNSRKRHGLPLRRGTINRRFKKSLKEIANYVIGLWEENE